MFEQFGEALYKSFSYVLDELEPRRLYKLIHVDASAREKWSKVEFKVEVSEDESFFNCECGTFEHSGMVCCHALQVMIHSRLPQIPQKHILKRWTRDARDVLPEHLARYQKDKGPPSSDTFRHHAMYIKALECVQLGDRNVKCYEVFMSLMKDVYATLLPLGLEADGMGLAEREQQANSVAPYLHDENRKIVASRQTTDGASSCSGVAVPNKKRTAGRPTTSRDKPPYEQHLKRSRFCSICRVQGHKSTTCPDRGDLPKEPRKLPKCSKCGVMGHRRNVCGKDTWPFEPNFL